MELSYTHSCLILVIGVAILAWTVLNRIWFTPKKLEKCLRNQGLNGNSYRFLYGDLKDMGMAIKDAKSKAINLSDDILPRVIPFLLKSVEKYGINMFTWYGPKVGLTIMDSELIKEVLVRNEEFHKFRGSSLTKLLVGGFGEHDWAKHRKIINPAFHLNKLKHMIPAFYTSCIEMLNKWEDYANSSPSFTCELDVWPSLQTFTADAISRSAFGSSYEQGRRIFELQAEQTKHLMNTGNLINIPGWQFVPTKRNRRMKEIAKQVNALIQTLIDNRIESMKNGEPKNDDLLGMLLKSNIEEIKQHGNQVFGLTIQQVIDDCKLFYFAGHETTSVLLLWTMVLLSKHQDWQTRAREEVLREFECEKPEIEQLNHLKIVTMILYEVLRLYPPIPVLHRTNPKKIKLGELSLPAEVHLHLPTILLHHDREIWGDDAKEFNPERFSEGVFKATKGKYTFFPFGGGPRICIGQSFAMVEVKLALAMILQRFSFELSPSYTHAPYSSLTLQLEYGAHLILHKL